MNCTQCDTEVREGAAFCSQCGAPVSEQPEKKRPSIIWSVLLGVAMIGIGGTLFIPAFAGHQPAPMTLPSSMIWGSLFFWAVWRYRLRTGWHGGLIGAGVGFLLAMLAAFVSGYIRASGGV